VLDGGNSGAMSLNERFSKIQQHNQTSAPEKRIVSAPIERRKSGSTRPVSRGVTKTRRTLTSRGRVNGNGQRGRGANRNSTGRGRGNNIKRGTGRGRGRGRGLGRGRNPEALNKDLEKYMFSDPEKGKDVLDTDLEAYMKERDETVQATDATTTRAKTASEKKDE